jgi:hypothetical protein
MPVGIVGLHTRELVKTYSGICKCVCVCMYAWIFAWLQRNLTKLFETQKLILLPLFTTVITIIISGATAQIGPWPPLRVS